uniref:Uncharacterized protein n=1 Tax=Anopheles dirus TaxID=7168 RepID=A0A182NPX4_9DIPT
MFRDPPPETNGYEFLTILSPNGTFLMPLVLSTGSMYGLESRKIVVPIIITTSTFLVSCSWQ